MVTNKYYEYTDADEVWSVTNQSDYTLVGVIININLTNGHLEQAQYFTMGNTDNLYLNCVK